MKTLTKVGRRMKWTSRLISIITTLFIGSGITLYYLEIEHPLFIYSLIGTIVGFVIFWWIGALYDRLIYYQKQLKEKEEELKEIFNNANACISSLDLKTGKYKMSLGTEKLHGYKQEHFNQYPQLWKEMIHPFDLPTVEENERKIYIEKKKGTLTHEHRVIRGDGEIIWLVAHITPVFNSKGEVKKVNVFSYDITDRKNAEKLIEHMAYHDNLTNLTNRPFFSKLLEKSILNCKRNHNSLAIMYLDIDHFKQINDTFGHAAGDHLLVEIAKILTESVRINDVVCRHGGDEFIILLENVRHEEIKIIAKRIIKELSAPITILNDHKAYISPSIGISLYPIDGEDEETLIKRADSAMYSVKKSGKNNYKFYSS
ncbi:hypothetical protein BKP37_15440 [Anaerobacillus alkalilacustris]|uniref:Sensor domain-containing diguanylate cyclase n=1 Tax=Anaerobacillus alkalilacustris TaxID=393763 RepID=A0A1S2LH31_9BACI|nr:sensor domain-containing diguanylate cyclase [Anaerobacillus alkalilacustris]OIJ11828.1 hypothetical protein BKP37_15440 [Anaerobacillus alkalilacustris]